MAPSPIVAIGASHASVQLVASLRQGGYTDDMIIVGAEPHLPYNRPPLSKTLLTQQLSFDKTLLRQQSFYDNHNIQLKLGARVKSISRECNQVILDNGETISYSKLVIATGADPIALNLPGEQLKGIGYLRNYDDTQTLMPYIEEGKTAVVVGGGYIGLETAAALRKAGMIVTVLEGMERVLQRVTSSEISAFYTKAHVARGVKIVTNAQAVEFVGQHRVEAVKCSNGKSYPADLVVIGVGVRPNTALANDAGLRVTDGIYIDEFGRTDDPDIFAIGDCTNFPCHFTNTRMRLESVPNAVEQAKSAAAYICGEALPYRALP
ncbi:MAG: NAD(P)/FAD-dependent oxidoreductase, partial [Porticoccaceae bacterium]